MSARRASAPARAEAAGGSPPSLHRLAISTPSVGACRLEPRLREACYDKLDEWEAWFDEKLQLQDWDALDRYATEGATLLRKDETRYFSEAWRKVWESMYMPWRGRKLTELYMNEQQTYEYVRAVSLGWYIRNNNGPDRIQAQVGAGCDDDPFTEIACEVKLAEWKKWIEQKLRDLQNEATVESAKAILNEYHAAGVKAWGDGKGQELSRAQEDLWIKMAVRVEATESWPVLGLVNWFEEYTYMKAVALAWVLRHNTGAVRVGTAIGDHCGDDWECMRKVNEFKEWFEAKRRTAKADGPARNRASGEIKKLVMDGSLFKKSKSLSGLKEEDARFVKEVVEIYGAKEIRGFATKAAAPTWVELLAVGWLLAQTRGTGTMSAAVSGWFGPDYRGMDAACGTTILSWSELRKEVPVGTRLVVTLRKADGTLSLPRGVALEDAMMKDPKKRVLSERTGQYVDAVLLELRKPYMGESELLLKEPNMHVPVGVDRELPRGRQGYAVCKPKPQ